jgi:tRNA-splicing endonuclease subunit Sen2
LAVKAGQQLADGIVALGGELTDEDEKAIERRAENELEEEEEKDESAYGKHIPGLIYLKPQEKEQVVDAEMKGGNGATIEVSAAATESDEDEYIDVADMERLQLSSYETLFLAGMLGVLEVVDDEVSGDHYRCVSISSVIQMAYISSRQGTQIPLNHLYALLMATTLPHATLPASPFSTPSHQNLTQLQSQWSRPDNPFLLNYITYHHFRSLGWVVKSGIKFCIDFLLYKRGPAFSHAE